MVYPSLGSKSASQPIGASSDRYCIPESTATIQSNPCHSYNFRLRVCLTDWEGAVACTSVGDLSVQTTITLESSS